MIRIVVDCFGGDRSPAAQIDGALAALSAHPDLALVLTGDEPTIRRRLAETETPYDPARMEIVHAPSVIDPGEKPTDAIRLKRDSSLMTAVRLLSDGEEEIAGLVSCGSTGAFVAAGLLRVGRLRGVIRPAFCPILPTMNGGIVGICDTGANVDVTPAYLVQYAVMASLYLREVYGVENPRVALLNIGVEEEKGDDLRKTAYPLLRQTPGVHFVGNMESRDLLSGDYDLVVCDGFSGNVLIKSTEGTSLEMLKKLKKDIYARPLYKMGALLMRRMFKEEQTYMDYQNYGGSVLLGCSKVMVKGHGSAKASHVTHCIEQAYRMQLGGLSAKIEQSLENLPQELQK
ncbi:MAG: phosphate acyltransferase PlsX [Clostridia bacterium]|nr:phosphate acyltransferase PlsX [Clostridia bacterium]